MTFAELLTRAMGDMRQEDLERLSGVNQATISKLRRGKTQPTLRTLEALERALPQLRRLRAGAVRRAS